LPLFAKAAQLGLTNKAEEATKLLMEEVAPAYKQWSGGLDDLIAIEKKLNEQAAVDAEAAYHSARTTM